LKKVERVEGVEEVEEEIRGKGEGEKCYTEDPLPGEAWGGF